MFARLKYDTSRIAALAPAILAEASRNSSSEESSDEHELTFTPVRAPEDFSPMASPARQLA
jgi:hypothetical protein